MDIKVFTAKFEIYDMEDRSLLAIVASVDDGIAEVIIESPVTLESWHELSKKITYCIEKVCE